MSDDCADELIDAIITARKIVLFGCGREGLQMRGLAMRLFHLGRDATVWGDMSLQTCDISSDRPPKVSEILSRWVPPPTDSR